MPDDYFIPSRADITRFLGSVRIFREELTSLLPPTSDALPTAYPIDLVAGRLLRKACNVSEAWETLKGEFGSNLDMCGNPWVETNVIPLTHLWRLFGASLREWGWGVILTPPQARLHFPRCDCDECFNLRAQWRSGKGCNLESVYSFYEPDVIATWGRVEEALIQAFRSDDEAPQASAASQPSHAESKPLDLAERRLTDGQTKVLSALAQTDSLRQRFMSRADVVDRLKRDHGFDGESLARNTLPKLKRLELVDYNDSPGGGFFIMSAGQQFLRQVETTGDYTVKVHGEVHDKVYGRYMKGT